MPTFDFEDITEYSESDPRSGDYDTLQVHHTVTLTYDAARSLMAAGGRVVSANGLMTPDGKLGLVVPLHRRAYTSASAFDHRSLTVECCNTSLGPDYGISDATHARLGLTLSEMVREGRSEVRYGPGGLIFHRDTPGSYATACPGPSMDEVSILSYAASYLAGGGASNQKEIEMMLFRVPNNGVYADKSKYTYVYWLVGPQGNRSHFTASDDNATLKALTSRYGLIPTDQAFLDIVCARLKADVPMPTLQLPDGFKIDAEFKLSDADMDKLALKNAEKFFEVQKRAGN